MVLESRAAEAAGILRRGEAGRIEVLLRNLGLPTQPPKGLSLPRILAAARSDKKVRKGQIRYALPRRIGIMARRRGRFAFPLSDAIVLRSLRRARSR
jgi:3-dehydroquinate synthase